MNKVIIYTDGACKGNPGPGGWGVLLKAEGIERELFGGEDLTTNNRMELMAVFCVAGRPEYVAQLTSPPIVFR